MSTPSVSPDPRIPTLPGAEIRRRFVEFFEERGHTVVPSASLVPAGDQTLLFTNSGMVQFKDALTGTEKRSYTRAVDYQRVLRVAGKHNDFEEVGRTPRHHTLFEMLGNWSFGDYFKREAIHWAWDFLTRDLGIPGERLAATVYSTDDVAHDVWRDEIGLPPERLVRWGDFPAGDEKNWWRMADIGPCGPCSELHFDRGAQFSEGPHCVPDHSELCPRWLEVWNLVFMEFDLQPDRSLVPLPAPGVDTGMGLERIASVIQQVPTNYDTDLFTPIHDRLREILGHDPESFEAERFSYQVIADHSRAVTFLIADDVLPSNEGRGYVLRRILRRAVRHGRLLGRREPFLSDLATTVIEVMGEAYPHLVARKDEILQAIAREEAQFARTLDAGTIHLDQALATLATTERAIGRRPEDLPDDAPQLDGDLAFRLHDTYGFPVDLTVELAAEYGVGVDRAAFERALAEQRDRSRSGRKAELSRHAELGSLYGAIQARAGDTEFLGYETTTAEGRIVAIVRDGDRARRVDRPWRSRGRPRSHALLRRGRRPGRRPGRATGAGWRERAVRGDRHPEAGRGAHRPSRDAPRASARRGVRRGRRGRRAARPHHAQPHGHASPAPGAPERGRRAGAPGGLARHAGVPALRLPVRPSADATTRSAPSRTRSAASSATTGPSPSRS